MTAARNTWQGVEAEVLARIRNRTWKPGEMIPNEADLATEFGCARTTVNRALRALADAGLLDRRRKAGTRVAEHPVRKATLEIPIIRQEVEARGQAHGYALINTATKAPPATIRARMNLAPGTRAMKIEALHLADDRPFVVEDRWVNIEAVPKAVEADFTQVSANEWLVANAPFTHGDIALSALTDAGLAARLDAPIESALFVVERNTWNGPTSITCARLIYAPGYQLRTTI